MTDASAARSSAGEQEFVIRAPGSLHQGVEYFLGKFPQGFSDFKNVKAGWQMRQQAEDKSTRRRGPDAKKARVMPLVLEDKPGHATHTGLPEGGISGSGVGMTYFVLVKEGPHFTALPVKDWYNFRSSVRNQAMSLEEAEKQMTSRGANVRLNAGSKLGALAAKAEAEGAEVLEGDDDGEKPDSDEERENHRAARVRAANAKIEVKSEAAGDEDNDMPSAQVHVDAQEKGEDWEHEEERADDDLEQGDEDGSDQDLPASGKREKIVTSDGDSDGEGNKLSDAQQELRRVLRKTHLSSGSEDGEGPSSSHNEDDEDEEIDLDALASSLLPKMAALRPPSPGAKGKKKPANQQLSPQPKGGEKRKASTPPVKAEAKKAKPGTTPDSRQEARKRESSVQSEATSGPPSAREISDALKAWGPVTTGELTARFRKRLATQQDKQAFMGNVKKVSKLEERPPGSGKKFVVPK